MMSRKQVYEAIELIDYAEYLDQLIQSDAYCITPNGGFKSSENVKYIEKLWIDEEKEDCVKSLRRALKDEYDRVVKRLDDLGVGYTASRKDEE